MHKHQKITLVPMTPTQIAKAGKETIANEKNKISTKTKKQQVAK